MYCMFCGAKADETMSFCQKCGRKLSQSDNATQGVSSTTGTTPSTRLWTKFAAVCSGLRNSRRLPIIVFVAVVVVVLIVSLSLTLVNRTSELADESIINDQKSSESVDALTDSLWGDNTGYKQSDAKILNREESMTTDSQTGDMIPRQLIDLSITYRNKSFKVSVERRVSYVYRNEIWGMDGADPADITVTPLGGVKNQAVINNVGYIISLADENPGVGSDGNKTYLADLYGDDYDVKVIKNATDVNGGTVQLAINGQQGMLGHHGEMTVSFAWGDGDWAITDVQVTPETYLDDYSSLVGTWSGTLQKDESYRKPCYGGRSQPLQFNVKSVDSTAKTLVMDISLLVHNHKYLEESAAETTEGDVYYTVPDVVVDFSNVNNGHTIYDSLIWKEGSQAPYFIQITMTINNGKMSAVTKTGAYDASTGGMLWEFYDTYSMTKA